MAERYPEMYALIVASGPWGYYEENPPVACQVCKLRIKCDTEGETKAQILGHVARMHPDKYESAVGAYPTPSHIKYQQHLIREGLL